MQSHGKKNEHNCSSLPNLRVPMSLALAPPMTFFHSRLEMVIQQPRINLSLILRSDPSWIKPRVPYRTTQHIKQIPPPIPMREWVGGRRPWYQRFVCLVSNLNSGRNRAAISLKMSKGRRSG